MTEAISSSTPHAEQQALKHVLIGIGGAKHAARFRWIEKDSDNYNHARQKVEEYFWKKNCPVQSPYLYTRPGADREPVALVLNVHVPEGLMLPDRVSQDLLDILRLN